MPFPPDRVIVDFVDLGLPEVVVLGHYNYREAQPPLQAHRHEDIFEICFLERGFQRYMVNSIFYDLTSGDLFITKPGEIHGTGGEPENKGHLYWLEFQCVRAGQSFLGLNSQESEGLMDRFRSLSFRHFPNSDVLAPTLKRLFFAHSDIHNPLRAANVKNLLLRYVLDVIEIAENRVERRYSIGVQRAIRGIEQNQWDLPDIKQLAKEAGMSESYFKRAFKKETGIPPGEYAMKRRIDQAKTMLSASGCPITRIAMDLGFATSQHFSTAFKRLTGLPPQAYRNRSLRPPSAPPPLIGAGPDFFPSGDF